MRIAILEDSLIQQERIRNLLDLNHRLCFFRTVEEYMESNFYFDLLLLNSLKNIQTNNTLLYM